MGVDGVTEPSINGRTLNLSTIDFNGRNFCFGVINLMERCFRFGSFSSVCLSKKSLRSMGLVISALLLNMASHFARAQYHYQEQVHRREHYSSADPALGARKPYKASFDLL